MVHILSSVGQSLLLFAALAGCSAEPLGYEQSEDDDMAKPPINPLLPAYTHAVKQSPRYDMGGPLPQVMLPPSARQMVVDAQDKGQGRVLRPNVRPNSWGNALSLAPPWSNGETRTILNVSEIAAPSQGPWRIPYTQALTVAASLDPSDLGANFFYRWVIEVGIGDGRVSYSIDGMGVQQITIPAESIRVLFKCERFDVSSAFDGPQKPISVSAFIADGSTSTSPPTFTQYFSVLNGTFQQFFPPLGATGFRVAGDPAAALTPYTANTLYNVASSNLLIDSFTGAFLLPIRQAIMPFSGQASRLNVVNVANPAIAQGAIVWEIDL